MILILFIFSTPWFQRMISLNFSMAFVVLILTYLLIEIGLNNNRNRLLIIFFIILVFVTSLYTVVLGFDKKINYVSADENVVLNNNHLYYSEHLGKIYLNKFGLYYNKNLAVTLDSIYRNIFYGVDLNTYFFDGHPRERRGVQEFSKFWGILLPVFILGLFRALVGNYSLINGFFIVALITSSVISPAYNLSLIMYFPFIVCLIWLGFKTIFQKINLIL